MQLTAKLAGHYNENNELQLGLIDKLIKCSTTYYEDSSGSDEDQGSDLLLDYWVNEDFNAAQPWDHVLNLVGIELGHAFQRAFYGDSSKIIGARRPQSSFISFADRRSDGTYDYDITHD